MGNKCGAKTRIGGKCQHVAGHRTDHVGTGKCYLHGGASKGPRKGALNGNKNAYKHGRYAKITSNVVPLPFEDISKLQEIKESNTVEPELDLFNEMYRSGYIEKGQQFEGVPKLEIINDSYPLEPELSPDQISKVLSFLFS
ncbi:hypothetical protein F900_03436 [Acinetobacter modestus]|uniref:Uncharacterized protein n=1 Tax=Acinetobacter modestus TaxID=1776740 RepID=N9N7I6_9GAMM|nr:hypothetical protein [Acinetobacter modestus]ENW97969.1 hypothetical protein F900_03436 [Acinetobacter modestus]